MKRKIIALALAMIMLMPVFNITMVSASYESDQQLYIDLGIFPPKKATGLIKPSLTREQFADILINMYGIDTDIYTYTEDKAEDISKSKYNSAINYCIERQYLCVDEDNKFRPSAPISYNDAVRAFVTLVEYDVLVKDKQSMAEYMSIATKLGFLRGVKVADPTKLSYDELYQIASRVMRINLSINDKISITSAESLFEKLKVHEYSGKIIANSRFGIGVPKTTTNTVNIDGAVYDTNIEIEDLYVGVDVTYYLKEGVVVSVTPKHKLETATITPKDIKSVTDNGSSIVIKTNTEYGKISISKSAIANVNNTTMAPTKKLFEHFRNGSATFVSEGSGAYSIVHMNLVKTFYVSGVSTSSYSLGAKDTNEFVSFERVRKNLEVYRNGKAVKFSDIKSNDVVSVMCNAFILSGGDVVFDFSKATWAKIYATDVTMEGIVESLDEEGKIYIGEMDYTLANALSDKIAKGISEQIFLDEYIIASVDNWGNIAHVEKVPEKSGYSYGYLIKSGLIKGGLSNNQEYKIMDEAGVIGVYQASERILVDGVRFTQKADTYNVGGGLVTDLTKRQVIKFRLSDNGEIKAIDTAVMAPAENSASLTTSLDFDPYAKAQPLRRMKSKVVDRKIAVGNDCVLFVDSAGLGMTDPSDNYFTVRKNTALDSAKRYYTALYDADDMGNANCGVIWEQYDPEKLLETAADSKTGLPYNTYSYMVEKVKVAIEDGEEYYKLSLADYKGKVKYDTVIGTYLDFYTVAPSDAFPSSVVNSWVHEKKYNDNPDNYPEGGGRPGGEAPIVFKKDGSALGSTLKKGDIVRVTLNDEGKVKYIERIFDFNESKETVFASTGNSGTHILFANLEKTSGELFMFENPKAPGEYQIFNTLTRPAVVVMDLQTGEVTLEKDYSMVPSNSVGDNVKVLLRDYDGGTVMEYFVYKY